MVKSLNQIKKQKLSDLLKGIKSEDAGLSKQAGIQLSMQAADFDLTLRDYLCLAVDFTAEEETRKLYDQKFNGYEMAKVALGLPSKNDFSNQITLAQASDTFARYPGARNLFSYVVDDMLRWKTRQDNMQTIDGLLANTRYVNSNELIRVVLDGNEDAFKTYDIGEGAEIPMRNIKSTDMSVKFGKIGSGYRLTYEFMRDATLDILTPYVARIAREKQLAKMEKCTRLMINGDGTTYHPAATEVKQVALDPSANTGKLNYDVLVRHIINQAKKGITVTAVSGNWDAYEQYIKMFTPDANVTTKPEEMAKRNIGPAFGTVNLFAPVNFVVNTSVPEGKLLCFNRAETVEELIRAGSQIQEEERNITNQTIVYTNTENVGYALIFGDTRTLYNYGAKS